MNEAAVPAVGRRMTPQRRVVWSALASTDRHPDAEQLIALVRRADPGISVATVYNTLRLLVAGGQAIELRGLGPRTRYDANTDVHDHFTCRVCGVVEDIPPQQALPSRLRGSGLARHRVESVSALLRGVCGPCRIPRSEPVTRTRAPHHPTARPQGDTTWP